ncbi:MAG: hypothetical protein ACI9NQ_000189 [Paracoccaceae bacterium]|jgi:hypothetical protein
MTRLHLLILWILAIGAGYLFTTRKKAPDASASQTKLETGSSLFASNLVDTLDGFKIEKGEDTVTLVKKDSQWLVAELDNYPANLTFVSQALEDLRESKIAQGVLASDEYYDRFNLDPSDEEESERPDTLTLTSDGKESAKLFIGKSRESSGGRGNSAGRFIRLADDDSGVYIVQQSFARLASDPSMWINKTLTPLEEGAIKIEVSAPGDQTFKPWVLSRKTVRDNFLVEGLGKMEETKANETASFKNTFAKTTFIELLSAEDAKKRSDEKASRVVKATDSAGSTFLITVTPEKKIDKEKDTEKKPDEAAPMPATNYIVSIQVLNGPTKPEAPAADASSQDKAVFEVRVSNLADLSASVNRMGDTVAGRYFLINKASVGPLLKSRGEFIQPKKGDKPKTSVTTKPIPVPSPSDPKAMTNPRLNPLRPTSGNPPPGIARPKENKPKKPKIEAVTPPVQVPPTKAKPKTNQTPPPLPGTRSEPPKNQEEPKQPSAEK